eukprot:11505098-Alexandrium_andersonii.AAC.1
MAAENEAQSQYLRSHFSEIFPRSRQAFCLRHKRLCPVRPPPTTQGTVWNISGPCCTPWSSKGLRSGLSHPAMPAWNVWSWGMADLAYGIITVENSEHMPPNILEDKLSLFPGRWHIVPI